MSLDFSELEKDMIREIVNISVAKAADAFAMIAKEKVMLRAPKISILSTDEIDAFVESYRQHTLIIRSDLKGDLDGQTYLLFTEDQVQDLARICLSNITIPDNESERIKNSLLLEIGNIITGALVSQFVNILEVKMFGSAPVAKNNFIGNEIRNLASQFPYMKPLVFTIKTQFLYSFRTLELPLIIVFDLNALISMLNIIRNFDHDRFELIRSQSLI